MPRTTKTLAIALFAAFTAFSPVVLHAQTGHEAPALNFDADHEDFNDYPAFHDPSRSMLPKLIVIAIAAAAAWFALQPRPAFVVRISDGVASTAKGMVTPRFLDEVHEVCVRHGVSVGWVHGFQRGKRISLTFSSSIPPEGRQQLRNLWAMSGWAPAKASKRPVF
jgi:hypothetical protein